MDHRQVRREGGRLPIQQPTRGGGGPRRHPARRTGPYLQDVSRKEMFTSQWVWTLWGEKQRVSMGCSPDGTGLSWTCSDGRWLPPGQGPGTLRATAAVPAAHWGALSSPRVVPGWGLQLHMPVTHGTAAELPAAGCSGRAGHHCALCRTLSHCSAPGETRGQQRWGHPGGCSPGQLWVQGLGDVDGSP